jgi:hypothetical protein
MALWGNNDAVGSGGTVSLDYTTLAVTGTGTTFGQTGAAQEGDVIRFGTRGGAGEYFGDAVIVSIAGTQSLTIDSTAGLNGSTISGVPFKVSQLPKFTVLDSSFSGAGRTDAVNINLPFVGTASTNSPVGFATAFLSVPEGTDLLAGDFIVNGGSDIRIVTVSSTQVTLGSTISAGISTGDSLTFKRAMGGYDRICYGISTDTSGSYHVTHEGWVGVTTYMGTEGELRVKKEVLVAMSGINTATNGLGEAIIYPTPEG